MNLKLSVAEMVFNYGFQYQPVCDSDLFWTLLQTWTNTDMGTLSSVSVNIAAGGQTDNFTISVFRFSTIEELVSPG